jgi:hypothetical protein
MRLELPFPILNPSQAGSTTADGSSAGATLRYNQMLNTSNHTNAKARTMKAKGVSNPKAINALAQPNQLGNMDVRKEIIAVAPINTAMKIANN